MLRPSLALALLISFTACSHQQADTETTAPLARVPGSATPYDADITLDWMMNQKDPRQETKDYVTRLLKIRLQAQKLLNQFDHELEAASEPKDLFEYSSYRQLQAARAIIDRMEHKIVALYSEARKHTNRRSASQKERQREDAAFSVVAGMRDALLEVRRNLAHRVLLNDLMQELQASFGKNKNADRALVTPLEGNALLQAAETTQREINQEAAALEDSDLEDEIEGEADLMEEPESARNPQSVKIGPSTGSGGNINGRQYPKNTWSLTYDDGPGGKTTPQALQNLANNGIKATFFWLAKNSAALPGVVKSAAAGGHELANHSYTHAQLSKQGSASLQKEIVQSTQVHAKVYGYSPKYFRCPYGDGQNNAKIRSLIAAQGMVHVGWNVDSLDWQDKNAASIVARVKKQMAQQGRGIVLFHDIHTQSVAATLTLMKEWKQEIAAGQKRLVTVGQAVNALNK